MLRGEASALVVFVGTWCRLVLDVLAWLTIRFQSRLCRCRYKSNQLKLHLRFYRLRIFTTICNPFGEFFFVFVRFFYVPCWGIAQGSFVGFVFHVSSRTSISGQVWVTRIWLLLSGGGASSRGALPEPNVHPSPPACSSAAGRAGGAGVQGPPPDAFGISNPPTQDPPPPLPTSMWVDRPLLYSRCSVDTDPPHTPPPPHPPAVVKRGENIYIKKKSFDSPKSCILF